MRDRIAAIGPIAAVAGVLGLCCGLPLLLSIGVMGAIAGWSLQNWVLIGLGLMLAVVGSARWARSRRDRACHPPASPMRADDLSDHTTGSPTGDTTRKPAMSKHFDLIRHRRRDGPPDGGGAGPASHALKGLRSIARIGR